jgi:hypothetical protein
LPRRYTALLKLAQAAIGAAVSSPEIRFYRNPAYSLTLIKIFQNWDEYHGQPLLLTWHARRINCGLGDREHGVPVPGQGTGAENDQCLL